MIIIVLGGLGSLTGTIVTSFVWVLLLEGVLRLVLPTGFETWRYVVYPLILLLVMLVRPKGLMGDYEFPFLRQVLPPMYAKRVSPSDKTAGNHPGQGGSLESTQSQEAV
jgi:branched-chain amino acid transport system permease protein